MHGVSLYTAAVSERTLTRCDEVDDRNGRVLALQGVLDHDATQFALRREVLDLSLAQLSHQCRLSRAVRTQNTITTATDQTKGGVRQQQQCTICQREDGVAKKLAFFVVVSRFGCILRLLIA